MRAESERLVLGNKDGEWLRGDGPRDAYRGKKNDGAIEIRPGEAERETLRGKMGAQPSSL